MYYQKVDKFMNEHVNLFKNHSFVLKPKNLRSKINKKKTVQNVPNNLFGTEDDQKSKKFNNCPLQTN